MGKGKKTNKMYISMSEWQMMGGKSEYEKRNPFRPLPFYACAISLQPFEDPVCNEDGIVFDVMNIIPYIKKFKKDPSNGKPLTAGDLIKLHFHKNTAGEYHCPVTFKVFNEFTHIVAVKQTGNVYAMEAIEELNMKTKNWTDLIDGTPFTKKDIISIQDPQHLEKRNLVNFQYVKDGYNPKEKEEETNLNTAHLSSTTTRVLQEMNDKGLATDKEKREQEKLLKSLPKPTSTAPKKPVPGVRAEHAVQAPSFTSSAFSATSLKPAHPADEPGKKTKKKGYVRLTTNLGAINLELHCDITPKACESFIEHCEAGYYDNVIFHRNIKDFMIQGGDPTGTGKGGESIWKKAFKDEFRPNLLHDVRGILSMANSGPNSNGSQFFITYNAAKHLDNKHTVFGRVVGGADVLKIMEIIPVDDGDRPVKEIKILSTQVFVNPFRHIADEEEAERKKEEEKQKKKENKYDEEGRGQWFSNPGGVTLTATKTGIGKYMQADDSAVNTKKRPADSTVLPSNKKTNV